METNCVYGRSRFCLDGTDGLDYFWSNKWLERGNFLIVNVIDSNVMGSDGISWKGRRVWCFYITPSTRLDTLRCWTTFNNIRWTILPERLRVSTRLFTSTHVDTHAGVLYGWRNDRAAVNSTFTAHEIYWELLRASSACFVSWRARVRHYRGPLRSSDYGIGKTGIGGEASTYFIGICVSMGVILKTS